MNYFDAVFYGYPLASGGYFWTAAKSFEDYKDYLGLDFVKRPFRFSGWDEPAVVACCLVPTCRTAFQPVSFEDSLLDGPVPAMLLPSGDSIFLPLVSFSRLVLFEDEESWRESLDILAQSTDKEDEEKQ